MGGDHQAAFRRQGIQQVPQGLARGGIQPREGLVQQEDVGLLGQRPRQEGPLLLAAGKLGNLAVRQGLHAQHMQGLLHDVPVMRPELLPQAQGRVAPHLHQGAHGDGEGPVHVGTLGQVGYFSRRIMQGAAIPQDFS